MMKIPNIFSHDNLPPLFSDKFREIGPEWKRLTGIDFERVGRILTCHLIIEHYLTNYIELQSPNEFDWSEARLTFSQKLKLAKKTSGLKEASIFKGIEIVNKIRNKFSHNLSGTIDINDIEALKRGVGELSEKIGFSKEDSKVFKDKDYSDVAVVEFFTSLTCAYIAGYCSAIVSGDK